MHKSNVTFARAPSRNVGGKRNMSLQRQTFLIVAGSLAAFAAFAAAKKTAADHGLRFDSPGVVDLAQRPLRATGAKALAFGTLDDTTAAAIVTAPTVAADPPQLKFSGDQFGCAPAQTRCVPDHEAKLIAAADGTVRRLDKRLVIAAGAGQPASFVDYNIPESQNAEGDFETHWYLGRLPGSGYHRVEVEFGHDAPGSFLVDPHSGKAAFVHNGSDLVAPSPDGAHLVTANAENPPLSVRVAALDASGPHFALVCAAPEKDHASEAVFKGWKDANTLDFVFTVDVGPEGKKVPVAVRATRSGAAWTVATNNAAALKGAQIVCNTF